METGGNYKFLWCPLVFFEYDKMKAQKNTVVMGIYYKLVKIFKNLAMSK